MSVQITAFTAVQDSWIHDTLTKTPAGIAPNDYKVHSFQARYLVQTSDTSITIQGVWPFYYNAITIWVNGAIFQRAVPSIFTTKQTMVISGLPYGAKTIEIVEEDASLTGIGSAGCNITLTPYYAPEKRIILYGTSIDVGLYASNTNLGWSELVRHRMPVGYRISNNSYAGAAVFDNNSNQAAQDAFIASLASGYDGIQGTEFWLFRETNDYGGASWTAAAFKAAVTRLYTQLRASYPTIQVKTISALLRTSPAEGTPNALGESLAMFRAAGAAAGAAANSSARVAFCSDLSGTAMGQLTTTDGLHPDTAGHDALASFAAANWFSPIEFTPTWPSGRRRFRR